MQSSITSFLVNLSQLKSFYSKNIRRILPNIICLILFGWASLAAPDYIHSSKLQLEGSFGQLLNQNKPQYEVFGFAPYWIFDEKMNNIDFSLLTTFAYFGIPVQADGSFDKTDQGYEVYKSKQATQIFRKAHQSGTKVILTLTQMDNNTIEQFLDNEEAWKTATSQALWEVLKRGIDGVNIDFEYTGDPGSEYRQKMSNFIRYFTDTMHHNISGSKVTVSVYASSVKEPNIYNIASLAKASDGLFMMAYDFATSGSDKAMPTSPLGGHKEGKYWYDITTAVNDFLTQMPPDKLILGLPWYGYNYAVVEPKINADTNKGYYSNIKVGRRYVSSFVPYQNVAQTYSIVRDNVGPDMPGISDFQSGWDPDGQVGWKAYYRVNDGTWRMVFLDDASSLGIKYDFAKSKKLAGVGMWALGFDDGSRDLWDIIAQKFGTKIVDNSIKRKEIYEII